MTERTPEEIAARLGGIANLVHGFIYFSPAAMAAYTDLGLTPQQHYFASRGAALGRVPAEVVIATFFNFSPHLVHAALPAAWDVADPTDIAATRIKVAGETLATTCADRMSADEIAEATALASTICDNISYAGTPLAGGNRALPLPDDPLARLWQLIAVVREWRGDVHVSALHAAPLDPVETLVVHAATGQVTVQGLRMTRQWNDADWDAGHQRCVDRGLILADGTFTPEGKQFRADIEHRTNIGCIPLVEAVGTEGAERLFTLLKPLQAGLLDANVFPSAMRKART